MDPELLAALCRDGTLWAAVYEADEPVGLLAAHELGGVFHIAEVSVAPLHQRKGRGARLTAAPVALCPYGPRMPELLERFVET